jgi:hypothetical protein
VIDEAAGARLSRQSAVSHLTQITDSCGKQGFGARRRADGALS